jgi:hypothetical protein
MKQSKMQTDQQNQQKQQPHQQQKQQQKTRHEQKPAKLAKKDTPYQEHEHPESRMTD